jgi:hypothetical protein
VDLRFALSSLAQSLPVALLDRLEPNDPPVQGLTRLQTGYSRLVHVLHQYRQHR